MLQNLSPKDLACTIGVSESSLKRWVDEGRLNAHRTTGGHRRISIQEAVRFLRRPGVELAQPETLGLQDLTAEIVEHTSRGLGESILLEAIRRSDDSKVRGIITAEFLFSRSVAPVCDGPISFALNRLTDELRAGGDGRAMLDRAADVLRSAVEQVDALLEQPGAQAPRAVGLMIGPRIPGLSAAMSACALRECGYAVSTLPAEAWRGISFSGRLDPDRDLVWISLEAAADRMHLESFLAEQSSKQFAAQRLVICGRGAAGLDLAGRTSGALIASTFAELQAIARAAKADQSAPHRFSDGRPRIRAERIA